MRKKIMITGATGGIGSALAHRLAGHHDLLLVGRNPGKLDDLCQALPHATPVVLDLIEAAPLLLPELGRLDALINNAAVLTHGPVGETTPQDWEQLFRINVFAAAALTRHCLPALRAARGQIVFVNSIGGLRMHAGWGVYGGSKYALRGLAEAVRAEEARHGIRVSTVFPGATATPMMERVRELEGGEYEAANYLDPQTIAATIQFVLGAPPEANVADVTVIPARQERI